jgi:hypothetical protein
MSWAKIKRRFQPEHFHNGDITHFWCATQCTRYLVIDPDIWLIVDRDNPNQFRNLVDASVLSDIKLIAHLEADCTR